MLSVVKISLSINPLYHTVPSSFYLLASHVQNPPLPHPRTHLHLLSFTYSHTSILNSLSSPPSPYSHLLHTGASKVIYLILVAMVSSEACSRGSANECEAPRNSLDIKEKCIVVMMVTGTMFEMGEVSDLS
jgi:hypothetical protein